jgi:uncharacterized protein
MDVSQPSPDTIKEFVLAAHGDFPKVQTLVTQYPDLVYASAPWQETGIQAAAHTANREIARFLLDHQSSIDICTAAMMGMKAHVESFVQTDPHWKNVTGAHNLPLMFYPAIAGEREIAEYLLENGAEINAGEGGNTALHGAVLFQQAEMVKWLLDHGAKIDALDYNGKTPLTLAVEKESEPIASLLREYGASE